MRSLIRRYIIKKYGTFGQERLKPPLGLSPFTPAPWGRRIAYLARRAVWHLDRALYQSARTL